VASQPLIPTLTKSTRIQAPSKHSIHSKMRRTKLVSRTRVSVVRSPTATTQQPQEYQPCQRRPAPPCQHSSSLRPKPRRRRRRRSSSTPPSPPRRRILPTRPLHRNRHAPLLKHTQVATGTASARCRNLVFSILSTHEHATFPTYITAVLARNTASVQVT
jgi:hypothetical protein